MLTNDDFFKATTTFFLTISFFILTIFFGVLVLVSADSQVKDFINLLLLFSMSSIVIFPLHFIVFPLYKEYWVEQKEIKSISRYILVSVTIIIEALVGLWIVWMILTIFYYPIYENIFGLF